MIISDGAYIGLSIAIISGRQLMWHLRKRSELLAAEQGSLRRVATAVVEGEPAERIYELVAAELARLIGAGAAGIMRLDGEDRAIVMGSWAEREGGRYEPGTVVPIVPGGDVDRAVSSNEPVRIVGHAAESPVGRLGYDSSIVAPIRVGGETWGVLAVTAGAPKRLTRLDEQHLMEFGDLLSTAIVSIEDRAKLAAQAATDPLTGLANHRTLQQRLSAEVARAIRHDTPLSVAVIDVDHFKQINDSGGHDAGDAMLLRVARCLEKLARTEDTLGRLGGDEFAWVLPETSREQALVAVERARRVIQGAAPSPYRLTVSAGICDTTSTLDPAELIRFADGALYWSKARGRDQCWIYDPSVVAELSAQERAERLERSQALLGLRALARAIDAKDPQTREHSDRVAELVRKLARAAGWAPDRALLLAEAALVHDVGKIGVPDTVLRKTEPLTDLELAQITEHAELSARIVEGVLAPEQVDWIRTHHERPNGEGYPDGLTAEDIPEGAALLALADAFDVMTISRPYSRPKTIDEAIEECCELSGVQFMPVAVAALLQLHQEGEFAAAAAARRSPSGRASRCSGGRPAQIFCSRSLGARSAGSSGGSGYDRRERRMRKGWGALGLGGFGSLGSGRWVGSLVRGPGPASFLRGPAASARGPGWPVRKKAPPEWPKRMRRRLIAALSCVRPQSTRTQESSEDRRRSMRFGRNRGAFVRFGHDGGRSRAFRSRAACGPSARGARGPARGGCRHASSSRSKIGYPASGAVLRGASLAS